MMTMQPPRLCSVQALPGLILHLEFINGDHFELDFKRLLIQSKGLAPLAQEKVFAQAQLIKDEGWAVVWPEVDIQIGADTLWRDAHDQRVPQ
ncbi:MAG: DUF2442 domain-containing protein [Betaproteobacteria bacterium]|jgi:Protein of unknown function (DUF2442)|nr:DUF2442 domain-containing protein [Betaproteobacteria bacterium]NBP45357.1 DUF2442 domain-containing protein [Betaproteobacteria bacterium]